jgi:hypothetical protein
MMGAIAVVALTFSLLTTTVRADDDFYDDYDDSHPLRLVAYAVNPVGYTLEWLVLRPIHALTSQPQLRPVFGTDPYGPGFRNFDQPGDMTMTQPVPPSQPTISEADLEALRRAAAEAQAAADEAKRAADEAKLAADEAARAADKSGKAFEKSLMK